MIIPFNFWLSSVVSITQHLNKTLFFLCYKNQKQQTHHKCSAAHTHQKGKIESVEPTIYAYTSSIYNNNIEK